MSELIQDETDDISPKTIALIQAFTAIWPDSKNGPARILLSDYNVDTDSVFTCLNDTKERLTVVREILYRGYAHENHASIVKAGDILGATYAFLQMFKLIPEDER